VCRLISSRPGLLNPPNSIPYSNSNWPIVSRYLPRLFKKYFLTIWHIQQKKHTLKWRLTQKVCPQILSLFLSLHISCIAEIWPQHTMIGERWDPNICLLRSPNFTPQCCFLCAFLELEEHTHTHTHTHTYIYIYIYIYKQDLIPPHSSNSASRLYSA